MKRKIKEAGKSSSIDKSINGQHPNKYKNLNPDSKGHKDKQ